jgi:hypothetical protein
MSPSSPNLLVKPTLDIGTLAYWLLPLVALLYSIGFLVVFTFSRSFGVSGSEYVQAKYIHVGTLYVMACLVILMPAFWIRLLWKSASEERAAKNRSPGGGTPNPPQKEWKPAWPACVIYSLMLWIFFILVAFTGTTFFHDHSGLVLSNLLVPLVFTLVNVLLRKWIIDPRTSELSTTGLIVASILILGSASCAIATILQDGLGRELLTIIAREGRPTGAVGFVAFMIIIAFYAIVSAARLREYPTDASKGKIVISTACIIGLLFYLSILSFAYAIYPHIPVERGGADYTQAPTVELTYNNKENSPIQQFKADGQSGPMVLIDENSTSLFLAFEHDGDPHEWRVPGGTKPKVYEIPRSVVTCQKTQPWRREVTKGTAAARTPALKASGSTELAPPPALRPNPTPATK